MEGLGGYASSSSDDEGDAAPAAAAPAEAAAGGAAGGAAAAAEAARAQRVAAMEQSDSSGSDDDDSDASDASDDSDDDEIEQKRAASIKASAVALPSAADLMAGGGSGGGIYHNPYEQKEIHTKRKMHDNEDNVIFKKVQGKKKVYGQGAKPKTNSSVARSWCAASSAHMVVPHAAAHSRVWRSRAGVAGSELQDVGRWRRAAASSTGGARTGKRGDRGHRRLECYEAKGAHPPQHCT